MISITGGLGEAHVVAGAGARPQAVAAGAAARVPLPVSVDHLHCSALRNPLVSLFFVFKS